MASPKRPGASEPRAPRGADEEVAEEGEVTIEPKKNEALEAYCVQPQREGQGR
jgi:hypothetical protein